MRSVRTGTPFGVEQARVAEHVLTTRRRCKDTDLRHPFIAASVVVTFVTMVSANAAANTTTISTYSISSYKACCNNTTNCDLPAVQNGDGFRNEMLSPAGTIWTAGLRRINAQVVDFNFADSSLTIAGNDSSSTAGFDRTNMDAIAYYTGHGICGGGSAGRGAGASRRTSLSRN